MPRAESPVAITGASGFIGGALSRALVARDRPVRVLLRGTSLPPGLEGPRCTRIQGDLHTPEALRALCDGAEVVVHCAAHMGKTDHPKSRKVNVEGTDNLLAAGENWLTELSNDELKRLLTLDRQEALAGTPATASP